MRKLLVIPALTFLAGCGAAGGAQAIANSITGIHGDGAQIVYVRDDRTHHDVQCAVLKIENDGSSGSRVGVGISCNWNPR